MYSCIVIKQKQKVLTRIRNRFRWKDHSSMDTLKLLKRRLAFVFRDFAGKTCNKFSMNPLPPSF